MQKTILLLLLSLLLFGCLQEVSSVTNGRETVQSYQEFDVDDDGIIDYAYYTFTPKTSNGIRTQRFVFVSTVLGVNNVNVSTVDLFELQQQLDKVLNERRNSEAACADKIGLRNVVCSDEFTCSKLCSSASQDCKEKTSEYGEVIGGSIIYFVQDLGDIRSLSLDLRNNVEDIINSPADYLEKSKLYISKVSSINTNPIVAHPQLKLCDQTDFGAKDMALAINNNVSYESYVKHYQYFIYTTISYDDENSYVLSLQATDNLDKRFLEKNTFIGSPQEISLEDLGSSYAVMWKSPAPSDKYILGYKVVSRMSPKEAAALFTPIAISSSLFNKQLLLPIENLMSSLYSVTGNYFLSVGVSLGIVGSIFFLAYSLITLLITAIAEKLSGVSLVAAIKRKLRRTPVRWKGDLILAILFLAAGYYISLSYAEAQYFAPKIENVSQVFLTDVYGALSSLLFLFGVLLVYFAIENFVKILAVERLYGMSIGSDKDIYIAKVASLKEKIAELEKITNQFAEEGFDVGKELEVLSELKGLPLNMFASKLDQRAKHRIDSALDYVEENLSSLIERKKLAEEKWSSWKSSIGKLLKEHNEVSQASLTYIPHTLRLWALNKFAQEDEGYILEGETLKRRKLTPQIFVRELLSSELVKGAFILKKGKVVASEFAQDGSSVVKALSLKLRTNISIIVSRTAGAVKYFYFNTQGRTILYSKIRSYEAFFVVDKNKEEVLDRWIKSCDYLE